MANVPPPCGNQPLLPLLQVEINLPHLLQEHCLPGSPPPLGALPPWLTQDVVAILGQQHPLPTNAKKVLPKFDLERGDTAENYINSFFLVVRMLGVVDEDIVGIGQQNSLDISQLIGPIYCFLIREKVIC